MKFKQINSRKSRTAASTPTVKPPPEPQLAAPAWVCAQDAQLAASGAALQVPV